MTKYEIVDEAVLAATPAEIGRALVEECAGRADWWAPTVEVRQHGTVPADRAGAMVEMRVNPKGRPQHRWGTLRWTALVTDVDSDRRFVMAYVKGDFRGVAEWLFEPVDAGRTRVRVTWRMDPHGLASRLAALLADLPAEHSAMMRDGFHGLERYAQHHRTTSPSPEGTPPSGSE